MYEWMTQQGFAPIIIATKSDKLKRGQINEHIRAIEKGLDVLPDTVIIPFSAETKEGKDEIWALIESLVYTPEELERMAAEQEKKANKKADKHKDAADTDRKARWKSTDKAVAKKTAKKKMKKKEANQAAAKKERQRRNRERYAK